jgi:hypothetical protein
MGNLVKRRDTCRNKFGDYVEKQLMYARFFPLYFHFVLIIRFRGKHMLPYSSDNPRNMFRSCISQRQSGSVGVHVLSSRCRPIDGIELWEIMDSLRIDSCRDLNLMNWCVLAHDRVQMCCLWELKRASCSRVFSFVTCLFWNQFLLEPFVSAVSSTCCKLKWWISTAWNLDCLPNDSAKEALEDNFLLLVASCHSYGHQ